MCNVHNMSQFANIFKPQLSHQAYCIPSCDCCTINMGLTLWANTIAIGSPCTLVTLPIPSYPFMVNWNVQQQGSQSVASRHVLQCSVNNTVVIEVLWKHINMIKKTHMCVSSVVSYQAMPTTQHAQENRLIDFLTITNLVILI